MYYFIKWIFFHPGIKKSYYLIVILITHSKKFDPLYTNRSGPFSLFLHQSLFQERSEFHIQIQFYYSRPHFLCNFSISAARYFAIFVSCLENTFVRPPISLRRFLEFLTYSLDPQAPNDELL